MLAPAILCRTPNVAALYVSSADQLLSGETDGMASDFTEPNGVGSVSVKDSATAANNITNYSGDAWWSNAGTSPKLITKSDGTLAWSPHNLFINSDSPATQSFTSVTGATYTVTVTGSGSMAGSSGASGTATEGSPVTYTATGTTSTWTITGSLTRIQANRGSVATNYLATAGAAKFGLGIDYANGSYGLLVEPAATNLLLRFQEIDSAPWSSDGIGSVTADNTTAPDGTATAEKIAEDTNNQRHIRYQQITGAPGTYTASVYLKNGDRQYALITWETSSADGYAVNVDLSGGTITDSKTTGATSTSSTITSIGNGWYRVTLTATFSGSNAFFEIGLSNSATPSYTNLNVAYVGTSKFIYAWGAQAETGTVATSPIPTFAATVTRAKDIVSKVGTAFPLSQTVGTVTWQGLVNPATGTPTLWEVGDGTTNELYRGYNNAGTSQMKVIDSGVSQADFAAGSNATISAATAFKSGYAWAVNDFAHVKDNGTAGTDVSGSLPTTTTIYLNIAAGAEVSARIAKMRYLPRRATNGELGTFTQ